MTRQLILAGAGLALAAAIPARQPVEAVNKSREGVALKGYDPVAYFMQGRPVRGSALYSFQWMGAQWWFSAAEHRDLFSRDPSKYAPQFGGYCAYAVSKGYTADVNPEAWKIVDGKLYLNYSKGVQSKWENNLQDRIAAGEKNWPMLHK